MVFASLRRPIRTFSSSVLDLPRGSGGRSSFSGIVATVFGSTGFLGRYVVNRLGRIGSQIVVPFRGEEEDYRHLKVMGDLGQIVPVKFHPRDIDSIRKVVSRSNVVINLVGKQYATLNYSMDDCNHRFAETVAQISAESGVARLIHVSALGASPDADSEFLRSKARGEEAVLRYFPSATILRPAVLFGPEDNFLNRFAASSRLLHFAPLINNGRSKMQPLHVADVANAVLECVQDQNTEGKVYELGGPEVLRLREVIKFVSETIEQEPMTLPVPDFAIRLYAAISEKLPNPPLSRDQVKLLGENILVSEGALKFEDLGLTPRSMKDSAPYYLKRFRTLGGNPDPRFASEKIDV